MKKIPRQPTDGDVPDPMAKGGYTKKVAKKVTGSATRYVAPNLKEKKKGGTKVLSKRDYK